RLSCRWALGKSFLQSEYTVKNKDGEDMAVTQFFGWDPVQGKIRSWFFDSKGGYGEAFWTRQKQTWTAAAAGVLPDGKTGSATNSIRFLDDKNFVWQAAEREVDGEPLADAEVKFTRVSTGQ